MAGIGRGLFQVGMQPSHNGSDRFVSWLRCRFQSEGPCSAFWTTLPRGTDTSMGSWPRVRSPESSLAIDRTTAGTLSFLSRFKTWTAYGYDSYDLPCSCSDEMLVSGGTTRIFVVSCQSCFEANNFILQWNSPADELRIVSD